MTLTKKLTRLSLYLLVTSAGLLSACGSNTTTNSDATVSGDGSAAGSDAISVGADATADATPSISNAIGSITEFSANAQGQLDINIKPEAGAAYLALLLSGDTTPKKQYPYTIIKSAGIAAHGQSGLPEGHPKADTDHARFSGTPAMLPRMRTCTFSAELAKLALKQRASGDRFKPALLPPLPEKPKVGDKRSFKLRSQGTIKTIEAEALLVDETAVFWIDRTTTPAASIEQPILEELATGFNKIIVPRERIYFGKESDINGDGLISVLLSPLVTANAVAYVSPCDLLDPKTITGCESSNQQELVYLSPPNTIQPPYNTAKALLETIAHEFQHAIYFYRKFIINDTVAADENPYITEGLSHLAQDLTGYQAGNFYVLQASLAGIDLVSVPNIGTDQITNYVSQPGDGIMRGAGYLLLRYLFDRAGGDAVDAQGIPQDKGGIAWLRQFVDAKALGNDNFAAKMPLSELAADFWTAMAIGNRGENASAINAEAKYNFLPTSIDPLTQRQRGCNLFTEFHGQKLSGPKYRLLSQADLEIWAGGAEFLYFSTDEAGKPLQLSIQADPAAKAKLRLIRLPN